MDGVGSKNLLQDSSDIMCLDFLVVLTVSAVGEDTVVNGAAFVALDGPGVGCEDLNEFGTAFVTLEGAWFAGLDGLVPFLSTFCADLAFGFFLVATGLDLRVLITASGSMSFVFF